MTDKDVQEQFKIVNGKMDRVLSILESDPSIDRKGLPEQVNDNKDAIEKNTEFKDELKTKVATVGGIVAFLSITIWELAKMFIFKK